MIISNSINSKPVDTCTSIIKIDLAKIKIELRNANEVQVFNFIVISFLDPRWLLEGSYEIGSVCPSVLPSFCPSFHPSICPGVFLEFYH